MRQVSRNLMAVATLVTSCAASAALPQAGFWSFDAELNGKPGRGIQIDRQGGETIIVTYYGYRSDGSATFYQASGKVQNENTFTGNLIEYKNGPALGGPVRSGEEARTVGPITLEFTSAAQGSVTLPGETKQSVSRYAFEDHRARLFNSFRATSTPGAVDSYIWATSYLRFSPLGESGVSVIEVAADGQSCTYEGMMERHGDGFSISGRRPCADTSNVQQTVFRFENLKVDENGILSGRFFSGPLFSSGYEMLEKKNWQILFGVCVKSGLATIPGNVGNRCEPTQLGIKAAE